MAAVPSPRAWVDPEIPPYATINAELATVAWLLRPPQCRINNTQVVITPNTAFAVPCTLEDDQYGWHSTTVNTSRVTPTFPGWYRGRLSVQFYRSAGLSGPLSLYLRKNGAPARARRDATPPVGGVAPYYLSMHVPFWIPMNGTTDYLELIVSHTLATTYANAGTLFCRWAGAL